MKTLAYILASAAALLALSSCNCDCHSYSPDALRDVRVNSHYSFD